MTAGAAPRTWTTALGGSDAARSEYVMLRDGSPVLIRQVRPTDASLLAQGFTRLSPHSRRMRFLTAKTHLSPTELRYLTHVDHHDHEALGALSVADGCGVGVARFIRDTDAPGTAEIAVTVVDAWQGRGLGAQLLTRLIERADDEGIGRFTMLIAADNVAMLGLLRALDADVHLVRRDLDAVEYEIVLTRRRCALCGTPADSITSRRSRHWICDPCIRAYVHVVAAQLDQPWWA